jgi:hypothetical protein
LHSGCHRSSDGRSDPAGCRHPVLRCGRLSRTNRWLLYFCAPGRCRGGDGRRDSNTAILLRNFDISSRLPTSVAMKKHWFGWETAAALGRRLLPAWRKKPLVTAGDDFVEGRDEACSRRSDPALKGARQKIDNGDGACRSERSFPAPARSAEIGKAAICGIGHDCRFQSLPGIPFEVTLT